MAVTAKGEILLLLHLEASDAAKHPIMYMTPPPLPPPQYTHTRTSKNSLVQNVSSDKFEKLCSKICTQNILYSESNKYLDMSFKLCALEIKNKPMPIAYLKT